MVKRQWLALNGGGSVMIEKRKKWFLGTEIIRESFRCGAVHRCGTVRTRQGKSKETGGAVKK